MWINDEASSLTLVEVLASHDHKKHIKINWNHQETKLTMENTPKANERLKSCVLCFKWRLQRRVYKRKTRIIIITRVFSLAAKSARVRSIALIALKRAWVFKVLAAWHLTMMRGLQLTWTCAWSWVLRSIAQPGELLYSFVFNFHNLTAFLCQWPATHLRHQKLTKTLENDTAKSLTNIS